MNNKNSIGVFDSGVGGLSVLLHLRAQLPAEDFYYIADSAYAPYGVRSAEAICARAFAIADFLLERKIKMLVVACNTATAAAVAELRARYAIPVVAMEPGIKPAVAATRSGVVGVLATAGTLESARFYALVNRHASDVEVITQPCAGLVELVEANNLRSADARALVKKYVDPLLARQVDTIVLGCTHYPFLRELIVDVAGPDIQIIDTGPAVAREVKRRLETENLLRDAMQSGSENFWTSAEVDRIAPVIRQLWREGANVESFG